MNKTFRRQFDAKTGERVADSPSCHIGLKSKRFGDKLKIEESSCKFCGHRKLFVKRGKKSCTRCRREQ